MSRDVGLLWEEGGTSSAMRAAEARLGKEAEWPQAQ